MKILAQRPIPRPFTPPEARQAESPAQRRLFPDPGLSERSGTPRDTPAGSRSSHRGPQSRLPARVCLKAPSGARAVAEPRLGPGAHHDRCGLRVPRGAEGLPARGWRGKQRASDATLPSNPEPRPSFGLLRAESVSRPLGRRRGNGARNLEWGCINRQPRPPLPPPPPPSPERGAGMG